MLKKVFLVTTLSGFSLASARAAEAASFLGFMERVMGQGSIATTMIWMILGMFVCAVLGAIAPVFCGSIGQGQIGQLIKHGCVLVAMGIFVGIFGISIGQFTTFLVG